MRHNSEKNIYLQKKKYIILTLIIILTSIIFLTIFVVNIEQSGRQNEFEEERVNEAILTAYEKDIEIDESARTMVYLLGDSSKFADVLDFLKYKTTLIQSFSELQGAVQDSYVVIDAEYMADNIIEFEQSFDTSLNYIVYNLTEKAVALEKVREMLAIADYDSFQSCKGIRILNGFWSDNTLVEKNLNYDALDLTLENGRQIYATEYAKDYDTEKVTPLVYRQIYLNAEFYVVNGELMDIIPQGILMGIFSQKETFLYPIINASYLNLINFPVLSEENSEELELKYSRDLRQFTIDILLPDMMILCENLGQKPTVFARSHLIGGKEDPAALKYYLKEMKKWGGEIGVMLESDEREKWENWIQEYLDGKKIESFCFLDNEVKLKNSSSIIAELQEKEETYFPVLSTNRYKTSFSTTYDLLDSSPEQTLKYWASVYAYGVSSLGIDMENIYYSGEEDWSEISKDIVKNTQDIYYQVKLFEPLTLHEAALKVKQYALMEPMIQYNEDEITVSIQNFIENADFVLKTDKNIKKITNGTVKNLGKDIYLVNFTNSTGKILLEEPETEFK